MEEVLEKVDTVEIQATMDYDMFQSINSNRDIDWKHVDNLEAAVKKKNLLHLQPGVVNSNLDLIDGQHRLEVCRRSNLPFYYIISDEITRDDIAALNSNKKNWTLKNYLDYWTIEGAAGYKNISTFINRHSEFNISIALCLLNGSLNPNHRDFKEGRVNVTNELYAYEIAGYIKSYAEHCDFAYRQNFVYAILHIFLTGLYDHSVMLTKLEYQSRSLVKCVNKKQYIEMLEEIYNYKTREDKRVKFI